MECHAFRRRHQQTSKEEDFKEVRRQEDFFKGWWKQEGFNQESLHQEGFDQEGFDQEGFDQEGFDKEGHEKERFLIDQDEYQPADSRMVSANPRGDGG